MRHEPSTQFSSSEHQSALKAVTSTSAVTSPLAALSSELTGVIRLITCGSVDDGKSTLIGRLLWDASPLYDDQRAKLLRESVALDGAKKPDFSRLLDGLMAEQEQGITIDIAWHFFDTKTRRFVMIDAPGHEQYTRNMATGASHADVAVLLVDAQTGIKRQTRRHLAILDLAGVRSVVLAVNKMDLVDWSEKRFEEIVSDFRSLVGHFPSMSWKAIPVSALGGDNVATPSTSMPWYNGPVFLHELEQSKTREDNSSAVFRMPVQTVIRDGKGFRGLAGTVTSGQIAVGDDIQEGLTGRTSTVLSIQTMDGALTSAKSGQAIVIQLEDDLDISRGNILAQLDQPVKIGRDFDVRLVWLDNESYTTNRGYLLRTATDITPITLIEVKAKLDMDQLEFHDSASAETNSIVAAHISVARPVALDLFDQSRDTGALLVVDAVTGAAVAGGVVINIETRHTKADHNAFQLTKEMLERGLCSDLPLNANNKAELQRRADEVAIILRAAGVAVDIAL